jgi:hypothetical protein
VKPSFQYHVVKHQERAGHAPASANRDERKKSTVDHSLSRLDAATKIAKRKTDHDGKTAIRAGGREGTNFV